MFLEYEISQLIDRLARPKGNGRADQYLAGYESGESADISTRAWLAVDPVTRRHSDLESIDVSAEEIPQASPLWC